MAESNMFKFNHFESNSHMVPYFKAEYIIINIK